jgi:DNA-binding transcriptional LysR family regulator
MTDLDLRDLDAFVAVARTRNFRGAAREQCVSASSRSRRLRNMEERLGVRLMHRTTCAEAGELLLARVGPAITDIGGARAGSGAGPVRCAVGAIADQCAAAGDRSGAGADGCAVPENRSEDRSGNRCRELVG